MDPEHKVRALAVTPLTQLPVGFMGRRCADIAVQAKFNGHPGSLVMVYEKFNRQDTLLILT